jgi:hypothetical protein
VSSSLRVAGPLAGLIVLVHAFWRLRWKALPLAAAYTVISGATTYFGWPHLWGAPISRYWSTVRHMSELTHGGLELFAGHLYPASQLPVTYLPTLLALQLTEPALLLCCMGLVLSVISFFRAKVRAPLLLFVVWGLGPVVLILGLHSTLYDNGRQTYFTLVPLFILAGLAFEWLFGLVQRPRFKALVVTLAILPGIVAGVRLHPYEYVYYNSLAGGTAGAYGRYEMDYWATSLQEQTDYLNSVRFAPINVLVYGPARLVIPYARSGDIVHGYGAPNPIVRYDYLMILIKGPMDSQYCEYAPLVHTVGREGVVFSALRRSPDGAACH